ncbi:nucleotidyltransferase domain-containing protein [Ruminococcus sp. AM27-11LB]|uniref:nucleotidyltransferase domain-containing protein n=1 Tax=Mediterraneibacter TaxID=2316020 RepID=UPI000E494695|nr:MULTISPECIES: nucleotidyltransferase domain-containing protein [Mediterraneibacter]RGH93740.1 nucleotidyltransferase domain-containing protein [Ruminococcus sp. AM27-11LB]RGH94993.1 nucleotidyltransferase domain-containing protein [Ruminococcus sp. AM27-27]
MRKKIKEQLRRIEDAENIKILLAVESGSRAWGFASPDSDYDVRFVYIRSLEDYLRLDAIRDVIELPIDDVLDINGWDLQKTLRLLHKSNPTLFEWFSSPIVYKKTEFSDKFCDLMTHYFSSKKTLYHYVSMAEGNYREYLKGDLVKAKKYFYVLRPVLACQWILDRGTPPPMLFSELLKTELPVELIDVVNQLLELKMNSPEIKLIKRISEINEYLDESIPRIKSAVRLLDDSYTPDWSELNQLFLRELMK